MKITVYGKDGCIWCDAALKLLYSKRIDYEYISIESKNRYEVIHIVEKANGQKTLPIIFVDEKHIGGYDQLVLYLEDIKKEKE